MRIDPLALRACPDFDLSLQKEQSRMMIERLNMETERWLRMAIRRGAGWNVWRGQARTKGDDPVDRFVIVYDFQLLAPGAPPPGPGYVFHQPDLTDGERIRLLDGRHDWREDKWEDDCGVDGCDHPSCERARL